MAEQLIIKKDNQLPPAEDYNFLRLEGIKLVEELSGKVWTDYNTHDPGITLLEALCYTLTDLAYRTSFEVKDLLATENGNAGSWNNIFFTARQVLPCNPVTLSDYRKLIIDTEGVRNAWIEMSDDNEIPMYLEPIEKNEDQQQSRYLLSYNEAKGDEVVRLRGLYKVFVEYEDDIIDNKKDEAVAKKIKDKLNFHRNLCEDFLSVSSIEYEYFKIEADIQVSEGTDIEQINARIYKVIQDFFSPPVTFYTLEQMVAKGLSAEDIFEGPVLKHGFIDTAEMEASEKFRHIHLSDIMSLVLKIEGVIAIKRFAIPGDSQSPGSDFTKWVNELKEVQKAPRLDTENSVVTFIRSGDRHRQGGIAERRPDKERVKAIFSFLHSADFKSRLKKTTTKDFAITPGEFMNVSDYYPMQSVLPATYGMAENYLDENVDDFSIRKSIDELLDEKVGTHIRKIITVLRDEKANKVSIQEVINKLLHEKTDKAVVAQLVNDLIEDEENERLINKVLDEIPEAEKKGKTFKEIIDQFLEIRSGYATRISEHTRVLKTLASRKYGLSLTEINKEEDIAQLRNEYKKIQIDRLNKRKKQTLQLRGFLMMFEQIMSDYLSQLSNIRQLFSFDPQVTKTFYPQPLQNIKNLESLFIDFKKYKLTLQKITENEESFNTRRADILDHLLGRFAESFDKYAFFVKSSMGKNASKKLAADKTAFLADYIDISNYRGKGFYYSNEENNWNSSNVEGLKKRVCRLLGLTDYTRKSTASPAIFVEKVTVDTGIVRYVAVLTDPNNKDFVLLKSLEYEFEGEAYDTLNYILENGTDFKLYDKEGRKEKWGYQLKRLSQEDDSDPIATSPSFTNKDEATVAFERTIETLTSFTEDENFHLMEHILLRPKIGPREKTTKRNAAVDADTVNLLPVRDVSDIEETSDKKKEPSAYKFKIINRREPSKNDQLTWKLTLLDKDNAEILLVKDDFLYYKHLTRRIIQIRQFASDRSNYSVVKADDGYLVYTVNDGDRALAVSKNRFRKQEDMDAEIAGIIKFFSYEEGEPGDVHGNYDDISYYADPYSFQVSIFMPAWPKKFRNPTFRHLLEKSIYLETPAHIYPSVYWLDHRQMRKFEDAYKLWLEEMSGVGTPNTELVNNLITVFNESRKSI